MKSAMNSAEYRMTSCSDSPNVERNSISTSIMPSMENDSNSGQYFVFTFTLISNMQRLQFRR